MTLRWTLLVLVACLPLVPGRVAAAPGDLDASFGVAGVVVTDPGSNMNAAFEAVALQSDGKILAVGTRTGGQSVPMVVRYDDDGALDAGFGAGGVTVFAPQASPTSHAGRAVGLASDGAILVGGTGVGFLPPATIVYFGFVSRLLPTGMLDAGFGTGGTVILDTLVEALHVLADDRILVAGSSGGQFHVRRLTASGAFDVSFGTGGSTSVPINGSSSAFALAVAGDGAILVVGTAADGGPIIGNCNDHDLALARLTSGGGLDQSFGAGGVRTTAVGVNTCDEAHAVAYDDVGRIVVAGFSQASSGPPLRPGSFVLARYDGTGTLDPTFGADGIVTTRLGTTASAAALALQPNGHAIAAGRAFSAVVESEADFDVALVRYRPNGRVDAGFGTAGVVVTPASPAGGDDWRALALQPDGRLVAVGVRSKPMGQVAVVARYVVAECGVGSAGICRPVVDDCDVSESCDGLGLYCPPDGFVGDGTSCDDGDTCTSGAACVSGVCGAPVADGTACADGSACTMSPETCIEGVCVPGSPVLCPPCEACDDALGCVATPAVVCAESTDPPKSLVTMKRGADPAKSRLAWAWPKGAATDVAAFGSPDVDADYQVCAFDQSTVVPTLLLRATVPGGGSCGGRPCWRRTSKGFQFRDSSGANGGVTQIVLQSGSTGKSRVALKGAGPTLALPALPVAFPMRVELRGEGGACFATTYGSDGVVRNDATQLKARGD